MSGLRHDTIRTNGIDMHVAAQGAGMPVVLCHGFPELWLSWRHQLPALAAEGFHAVAPDMRGYGHTDAPADVHAYDVGILAGDLVGLLDAIGEERAVFVGHDWGGPVVWHLALAHPERVIAVASLSVALGPEFPIPPTRMLAAAYADRFHYMDYFQTPGVPERELERDPHRTLLSFFWSGSAEGRYNGGLPKATSFLDWTVMPDRVPEWLGEEALALYVDEFSRTGFRGALNWYRNLDRNWQIAKQFDDRTVGVPALFIGGERDNALRWYAEDVLVRRAPRLRSVILPNTGHWTQQENPTGVNRALLDFLRSL